MAEGIFSVWEGNVIGRGFSFYYGHYLRIDHGDGIHSFYGHLNGPSPYTKGGHVERGAFIGCMGRTGKSTGIHLYLGIWRDSKWRNPLYDKIMENYRYV